MAQFDLIIKDGTVVDGTRVPRYRADIGIKNGKIAKIGRLHSSDAVRVLDAHGLIVAPGFIDLHTHFDAQIHWDPYCSIAGWHGITSVTIGNCGFGFAPVYPKDFDRALLSLSRNEAIPLEPMKVSMAPEWETFPQWMDHLDRIPLGINLSQLVPVTPLVAYAMGGFTEAKMRLPNEREVQTAVRLFHEAMQAGAVGWGAQRLFPESTASVQRDYDGTPMISDVLPDAFYLALAQALRDYEVGFIQITQSSATPNDTGVGMVRDVNFSAQLAEVSDHPVVYNALVVNDQAPEALRLQLQLLAEASAKGIPVYAQAATVRAPFVINFQDWNLFDDSPVWREATLGTLEEKRAKLSNPELRKAMRAEYDAGTPTRDFIFGELRRYVAHKIVRADLRDKYLGLSLEEIAKREHKHVIDAMLDITVADDLQTEWLGPITNSNARYHGEMLSFPGAIPGVSDGGAHVKFVTLGTYPTDLLSWLVRDTGTITLEEAHFRLSCLPARAAQFRDRGILREGLAADIVVYDLEKLKVLPQEIAYDLPAGEWRRVQKAEGYRWILVNGQVTFEDGRCTGATPGKLLRHGRAQ
ncbi:MAG: amidohydrolase family protein [Candidatus Binatia bacterium]|nr:amidohydrolase family protein [Candidatus Binatia bacterium]